MIKYFYCSQCDYSTHLQAYLNTHTLTKHNSNGIKCTKCEETFASRHMLRNHRKICVAPKKIKRSVPNSGLNTCPNCHKNYLWKSGLSKHLQICGSTNLEYFQCDHCNYKSPRKNDLRCHLEAKHMPQDPNSNRCKNCGKRFSRVTYFKSHLKLCGQPEDVKRSFLRFTCDYCQHKTYEKPQLINHIRTRHLPRDLMSYKCKNCGKLYNSCSSLNYHLRSCGRTRPLAKLKFYYCDDCDYKATRKFHLIKHIQNIHLKVNYKCDLCEKSFSNLYDVRCHKRRVHEILIAGKYFHCDHCKYKNLIKQSLILHIHSKHMNGTFKCPTCTKSFTSRYNLHGHAKYSCKNSSILKRLTCDHCQYQTGYKSVLVNHIQSAHMGVRYKCEACGNSLKSKNSYRQHVKYICKFSSNFKRYSCDHCQYKASVKNNLVRHIQLRHSNLTFKCDCGKSYRSQEGLNHHRRNSCKKNRRAKKLLKK